MSSPRLPSWWLLPLHLAMGRTPTQVSVDFGKSFWNLIPFAAANGFVIDRRLHRHVAPPVRRVIEFLARFPKTPKVAVAYVAFMAMITSLLSWGFSMIFAGILLREISKRVKAVECRAMGAAGYLGLGSVWALGLSAAHAYVIGALMATKGSMPPALLKISGVIPARRYAVYLAEFGDDRCAGRPLGVDLLRVDTSASTPKRLKWPVSPTRIRRKTSTRPQTPGEKLEFSPFLTLVVVALGLVYLFDVFRTGRRLHLI